MRNMLQSFLNHDFHSTSVYNERYSQKAIIEYFESEKMINKKLRYINMSILVHTPKYKKSVTLIVTSWFSYGKCKKWKIRLKGNY